MQVLPVYDLIRLPRANRVLQTSLEAGDAYEFAGPDGDDMCALANNLSSRWAWIWEVRQLSFALILYFYVYIGSGETARPRRRHQTSTRVAERQRHSPGVDVQLDCSDLHCLIRALP